jgi:transcriptional regulator with XRE-family HTH domain
LHIKYNRWLYYARYFYSLFYFYIMNTTKNNGHLGKNIRLLRKQKGLTQVELAKIIGCSQAMITTYESDQKKPSVSTLAQLAEALGVSIDHVVGKSVPLKTGEKIKNPKLWKKFAQLDELPDADKRTVFRMIDGLLAQRRQNIQ